MPRDAERIHHLMEHWVRTAPDRPAVADRTGRRLTFAEFGHAVDEAADILRHAGVRAGDRVAVVTENSIATACFMLACSRLDAWINPLNARLTADEVSRITAHARPRTMVFTSGASDAAAAHGTENGAQTIQTAAGAVMVSGRLPAEPEKVLRSSVRQTAALFYTTGTTDDPKGVMLSHKNLMFTAAASGQYRGICQDDHIYCVLPVSHIFSFTSGFLAGLTAGAFVELVPRFEPDHLKAALADRITVFQGVPQLFARLLEHLHATGATLNAPRLRYISAGGSPLDVAWKRKVEAVFGLPLYNGYGLTECSPTVAATSADFRCDDDSVGRPVPGVSVRLAPPPGKSGLDEGIGEILVKGANTMLGYYRNPQATAVAIGDDGWLRTGDLGRFGDDGQLYVVGRCKELIIRSGFNVYPPEVEGELNAHPAVVQAAVIGRQSGDGNEEVLAFVEVLPGAVVSERELHDHLQSRLAPYKRPSRILIVDRLPAASTGKILKHKLVGTFVDRL